MPMVLGSSLLSPSRWQVNRLAVFASWDDEASLDSFLATDGLGASLAAGWHVRLKFLRRWGHVEAFDGLPPQADDTDPEEPVVAVTLARMRWTQIPRFIRWGKPVERLVRDHPGQTFALAATRPSRTVSTFSVWNSAREMQEMVHGNSDPTALDSADRHSAAMAERNRKDFHVEFTTLRFRCISEHGEWHGRTNVVPK